MEEAQEIQELHIGRSFASTLVGMQQIDELYIQVGADGGPQIPHEHHAGNERVGLCKTPETMAIQENINNSGEIKGNIKNSGEIKGKSNIAGEIKQPILQLNCSHKSFEDETKSEGRRSTYSAENFFGLPNPDLLRNLSPIVGPFGS